MSVNVAFNNVTYAIPNVAGESGWSSLTDYLVALATNAATQGALRQAIRVALTSPVTVTGSDTTIVTDLTAPGAVALTLPTGVAKQIYIVVDGKGDAATNPITVSTTGQLINGAATYVMNIPRGGVMMQFDGTQWRVLAAFYGSSPSFTSATFTNITVTSVATIGNINASSINVGVEAVTTPANTQTFTNKTYNAEGVGNALSNVKDSNIKALAAIARSKLAAGTISHVVINAASDGAFSSEAALAKVRGGTGADNTSVTFPASGTLVTQTATEALTNKTLNDTSNVILKGGNTTGVPLFIGTNDNNQLVLETDGISRMQFFNTAALTSGDAAFAGNAGLALPTGTTAQRPGSALAGTVRLNTQSNEFEGFANSAWQAIGGGVNEQPLKNYLKSFATAAIAPGATATVASTGPIALTAALFYADTVSGAASIGQSTSTALRGAFNYLTALTSFELAGFRFVQFPAFAVEGTDLGKPVSISFDVSSTLTDGDWDVVAVRYNSTGVFQELISVAGNASTCTNTPSAKVIGGTGTQRGFFVPSSTAGDLYALRFRRLAGSIQLRVDTLFVGPQTQLLGAAVTDEQTYTPTITNGGGWTYAWTTARWSQVGSRLVARYRLGISGAGAGATGINVSLPNGLLSAVDDGAYLGECSFYDASAAATIELFTAAAGTGTNNFYFLKSNLTGLIPNDLGAGDVLWFTVSLPISGWSSNITLGERALEEYASVASGTSTPTVYGPAGSTLGTGRSNTSVNVTWQGSYQATDSLALEWQAPSTDDWIGRFPYVEDAAVSYGATLVHTASTGTVSITWGGGGYSKGTGATWDSLSTWKWRVRKVSSGAAVGYPIGARNVVGDVSGTAVPLGYIGERIVATATTLQTISTPVVGTLYDVTSLSIALTPGVWDLYAHIPVNASWNAGVGYAALCGAIRTNAGTAIVTNVGPFVGSATLGIAQFVATTAILKTRVIISVSTTYKASIALSAFSGSPTYSSADIRTNLFGDGDRAFLEAVRIA